MFFSTKCSFGASYEVGSPEDADTMPPGGYYALLEEVIESGGRRIIVQKG